ncbi:MAG: amidohydrolase family protein, partial [Arenimonas sp.]|nr:amidohydrolase family protein [Arenimonas sp.]
MLAGLSACNKAPLEAPVTADTTSSADAIYTGGQIVTINDAQPNAEALAVKDGKILAVGGKAEIEKAHKGKTTEMVDLAGKTLMPGFIDGHAHVQQFGAQAVGANLLAPPDGEVNTIDDVVAKLKTFSEGPDVEKTGWVFGVGFDDALLGRFPTREDLDKVSTTLPVMATHISGHFASVNTLGLKLIGYDANTPNPQGGVIRREADGKTPNGVLEELAAMPHMVKALVPKSP